MSKKTKREAKRQKRLDNAFKISMGRQDIICSKCKQKIVIPPIDGWTICICGTMVQRSYK